MAKVFVDKRTQDKVTLLADNASAAPPAELLKLVDASEIPECCGGNDPRPMRDLISTLED